MAFSKNITNCISVICNFRNVSPQNTFWERCKKRKCFVIKHLRFYVSQKSENYSHSRAPCAAANRCWLSTTYRVIVKYWHLKSDTFCAFLHVHGNENVFLRQKNLILCHIFNFWFYKNCSTQVSQSLTVNASHAPKKQPPKTRSANYVCKVSKFFWLYTHFARFSCRMCLFLI